MMRRLEFAPKARRSHFQAKDSTEAMMVLAQIARERRRLEQERACLLRRIGRIDGRISEISTTETRIVPLITVPAQAASDSPTQATAAQRRILPTGLTEMTLQY